MEKEIIVFVILIGALVASGCSATTTTNQTPDSSSAQATTTDTTSSTDQNASATPTPTTAIVNIQNFEFNPSTVTISVGDTVQWNNLDTTEHDVHAATFDSSEMPGGSTYNNTFTQAGTYNYTCALHPSMKGQVIVQ
jgi:plastocyanin